MYAVTEVITTAYDNISANLHTGLVFLDQCSATFYYSRHTKTTSKFSRHTSTKKRRKFTHQITVTTPMLSAVQWDAWGCRNELNHCMMGCMKWQLEVQD